jgi:VIT1/CCC1 family predicted Fe2+/Mn2+ transporter
VANGARHTAPPTLSPNAARRRTGSGHGGRARGQGQRTGALPAAPSEPERAPLICVAKGLPPKDAKRLADRLVSDPEHALDTLAREELGLNPEELGSPWGAAISSFLSFAAGALLPLAPFVFAPGPNALAVAIGVTGVALFGVGALLSLFTGRNALQSGARMLMLGALAGAITYAIGRLAGVAIG